MAKELLAREEVKTEDTWRLEDLYPDGAAWEKDVNACLELAEQMTGLEKKIALRGENLLQILEWNALLGQKLMLVYEYAERLYDQDQTNSEHQAMSAKAMNVYAQIASMTSFVEPEINAMSEEQLEEFLRAVPALDLYRRQLSEMRRLKPHTLSAEMEKLLADATEMSNTASDVFSVLNNADFEFPELVDADGDTVRITHGRYGSLMESGDRRVRKEAFEKLYSVYKQYANTLAGLYNGQLKQQIFFARARKYANTLEAAVSPNDVPVRVYYNLIETVNDNLDKLHRYVALRKKCLDVEELHMYDIYTPMIGDVAREISFQEAKETIVRALAPLGEEYCSRLREGFESRWIDVYENKGKRSGAYSAGAYGVHPFVLLNYNGTLDSMFTLAHEMGHALHSCYSNENQPFIYSDYKIFVAEVASTTNEILLMEYLLKKTDDPRERAYLLNHYLDSFKGTIFRQTQFAEFELRSNELCESGESLNARTLQELYLELNKKYYGPEMISDEEIAYEWSRIPHFYYNFYVYQYATSFSASVAIARRILTEGESAVERYIKFLSGGSSESPVELLKIAGVNLETAQPIQAAMDAFGEILEQLEQLV